MTQVSLPTDIALLQELAARDLLPAKKPAKYNLADLIGGEIDLADSISVAQALTTLDRDKSAGAASIEAPQKQWLNARGRMIRFVLRSMGQEGSESSNSVPFSLPPVTEATLHDPKEAVKAYSRFYSLHQSEMEHRVAKLRTAIRASLAYEGPEFIRLGNLDRILDDTLRQYVRRALSKLSKMVAQHYHRRRSEFLDAVTDTDYGTPEDWLQDGGWLTDFHRDVQRLLMAEIDFRLLPTRALLDALESKEFL